MYDQLVKTLAKRLLIGSPWEETARRAHHALTRNRGSLYDAQTIAIMRRVLRRDSNAIDVGAFEGGMLKHIVRLAPRGKHMAFEPLPDRFEALKASFPGVEVHPYAVSDRAGTSDYFRVRQFPALSGLRPPWRSEGAVETIRVATETLDRLVPADRTLDFIKVDVEGGELAAFRGALETLRRTRPIVVFECGAAAAQFGATSQAIRAALQDAGLLISTMGAWLARRPPLSGDEFCDLVDGGGEFYFIAHP